MAYLWRQNSGQGRPDYPESDRYRDCPHRFCGKSRHRVDTADVLMGLMAVINVPIIFLIAKPALRCLEDYRAQKQAGKNPVFKAADIELKEETDFWN